MASQGLADDPLTPAFDDVDRAPHVVIFPYDEHGHVMPAFVVGRALARRWIRATGVLTATRYATVSPGSTQIGLFRVLPLPESPPPDPEKEDDECYQRSLQKLQPSFEELMLQLQPQASCLISDILFPWSQHIADRLAIPHIHCRAAAAAAAAALAIIVTYTSALCERGLSFQPDPEKEDEECYQRSLQKLQPGFEELMLQLQPQASCLISDILFPWSQHIADRLAIPRIHCWASTAALAIIVTYISALCERGLLPFQPGMDDELVDFIPGLPKPFRLGDIPIDFLTRDHKQMEFLFWVVKGMNRATGALFMSTVYELEVEAVNALCAQWAFKVYTVGAIGRLESAGRSGDEGPSRPAVDNECLEWLDKQRPASVVYVALGSIVCFTDEEAAEMARGLEACGQPFLWVLRRPRDGNSGDRMASLPDGFLDRTKERGRVTGWALQTEVLAHPSVGCFLTHCGTGSLVEAVWEEIPLIGGFCKVADQNTILRLASKEWGIAMPLFPATGTANTPSLSSCVVSCVKEAIHGEKRRLLRGNLSKVKATLDNAVAAPNGSSFLCLEKLAQDLVTASSSTVTASSSHV